MIPTPPNTQKTFELNAENSFEDIYFLQIIESTSELYNEAEAKTFGLENWAKLSENSRTLWDWVFDRANRLPAWKTTDLSKFDKFEKNFDAMEAELF